MAEKIAADHREGLIDYKLFLGIGSGIDDFNRVPWCRGLDSVRNASRRGRRAVKRTA